MSKYNLTDIYEEFRAGDKFSTDFDYDGMLMAGLKAGVDTDMETLQALSDSFEDVNYHTENHHLQNAIDAKKMGATKEAAMFFGDFHAEIKQTIKDQGMDIEPTLGKFMASKMEEGEEVEEVTSREGSRMEGLVDQRMKAKFLEAFADLYFDLTDEDPFQAEDVVDYLGIEMLKHLDNIQAQGDRLAGVNTDADFEREQRMQMDMREEEMTSKDRYDKLLDGAASRYEELENQFIKFIQDNYDKDFDMEDFKDFQGGISLEESDKLLKEHFGRFMKDYQ